MTQAASEVGREMTNFLGKHKPKQEAVQQFVDVNNSIDDIAGKLFREQFGWEVLQVFDRWEQDLRGGKMKVKAVAEERNKVENRKKKVQQLQQKGDKQQLDL